MLWYGVYINRMWYYSSLCVGWGVICVSCVWSFVKVWLQSYALFNSAYSLLQRSGARFQILILNSAHSFQCVSPFFAVWCSSGVSSTTCSYSAGWSQLVSIPTDDVVSSVSSGVCPYTSSLLEWRVSRHPWHCLSSLSSHSRYVCLYAHVNTLLRSEH